MKKKIWGTSALVIVLFGTWFVIKDALWLEAAPYGGIKIASAVGNTPVAVGDFTLEITKTALPQLVVRHKDTQQPSFASVPGKAFVAAARGEDAFHEARGMTQVKSTVLDRCTDQTVDNLQSTANSLTLVGTLGCPRGPLAYQMTFKAAKGHDLVFELQLAASPTGEPAYNLSYLISASHADEGYYGFGEQYSHFNQKGRKLPILVSEQGVGRGLQPITLAADLTNNGAGGKWHNSYAGVPQFITTDNKSLLLNTHDYAVFDMRRDEATVLELHGNRLAGHILAGNTPLELIEHTTAITGRMRPLPEWVTKGAIIGLQGGTEKVRQALDQLNAEKTPLGAFWLQDWVGQRITSFGKQLWWNWTLDTKRYPGWPALTADLKKQGIEVMTYINPFLADVEDRKTEQGPNYRNLFREARDQGFLVKKGDGSPYLILNTSFSAGLLDLTNPKAWAWMKEVIKKEVIGAGSLGWMADFGEGFPMDGVTFAKVDPVSHHNAYPELWAQLNREAIAEAGVGAQATFFSRSGYTRSPQYSTLFWLGDQLVTWDAHDGLKTAVTGLLTSGISGYAFNHSDIGGYTTITSPIKNYHRSKELQMRWTEMAAFNVVFRTHQGNRPDDNWQFNSDAATLSHFSRMAKVYACWEPYRRRLVNEAAQKGWPVVRHPYLHYPQDVEFRNMDSAQFMVGADMMVVPVLDPDTQQVAVFLPQGEWEDVWTGKPVANGHFSWNAPFGKPATFIRQGSTAAQEIRACLVQQKLAN